jgi:hypothetical protein
MPTNPSIIVEFFGIPRERAGRTELAVAPGSLAEILQSVEQQCPRLVNLRTPEGGINPHYRISLDGERFLTDVAEVLVAQSHVLILSADAGG